LIEQERGDLQLALSYYKEAFNAQTQYRQVLPRIIQVYELLGEDDLATEWREK